MCSTLERSVILSSDDAEEEQSNGDMDLTSTDLELVSDGGTLQYVGIRFQDIAVPKGATIQDAYIEFTARSNETDDTDLYFYGHDVDDSGTFLDGASAYDISNRLQNARTDASVAWLSVPQWITTTPRAKHTTPGLALIVQEIVDRANWSNGNAMSFLIDGSGERTAYSFDHGDEDPAKLVISYCIPPDLGDRVWEDLDGNGIQDAGEPGVSGVTVNLRNGSTDSVIDTTTTDASGEYGFASVPTGTYYIEFEIRNGYELSPKHVNGSSTAQGDPDDSDANPNGRTDTFSWDAVSSSPILDFDAGLIIPPMQCETVHLEAVADTLIEADNPTFNYGAGSALLADGSDPAASSLLKWDLSALPTSKIIQSAQIHLNITNHSEGASYEAYQLLRNWAEGSGDGTSSTGDGATWTKYDGGVSDNWDGAGAQGANDRATEVLGSISNTATGADTLPLNAAGLQLLDDWIAGTTDNYGLIIQDYGNTGTGQGMDFDSREVATPADRLILEIEVCSIMDVGDDVWFDRDGNGIKDAGEPSAGGVIVNLFDTADNLVDSDVSSAENSYSLSGTTQDSDYYLEFVRPAGYAFAPQTTTDPLANDNDSDADTTTGRTSVFTWTEPTTRVDTGLTPFSNGDTECLYDLVLVQSGSDWKYLDTGNRPQDWEKTTFDDFLWASGPAPLGYGDSHIATTVSYGSDPDNKYITTYFRYTFDLANASDVDSLRLHIIRDDGAVVYLNSTEVYRSNMPFTTIDNTTLAVATVSGSDETEWNSPWIDAGLLRDTGNVIAVEIHQKRSDSSDQGFDLRLTAATCPNPTENVCYGAADNDPGALRDGPDALYLLDVNTSDHYPVGDIGTGSGYNSSIENSSGVMVDIEGHGPGIEALAYDHETDTLYATSHNGDTDPDEGYLGTVDKTTGVFTRIGGPIGPATDGTDLADIDGLALDFSEDPVVLYGTDRSSGADRLIQIDIGTGTHVNNAFGGTEDYVSISCPGVTNPNVDDIAINADGDMWGICDSGDATSAFLVKINKDTGAEELAGGIGSSSRIVLADGTQVLDIEGMSFTYPYQLMASTGNSPDGNFPNQLFILDDTCQYGANNDCLAKPVGSFGSAPFDVDFEGLACEGVETLLQYVEGIIYEDVNNNGIFDPTGDVPWPGVDVIVTDSSGTVYTVTTDSSGYFNQKVTAGTTLVDVDDSTLPAGAVLTINTSGEGEDPSTVVVPVGLSASNNTGYVFSAETGSIGDTIWIDANGNGNQDPGEPGIGGVTVELDIDSNGTIDFTTVTNPDGKYTFNALAAGSYTVKVDTGTLPPGYVYIPTYDLDGGLDNEASLVLGSGQNRDDVDFGYRQEVPGSIGDFVWDDLNGDGIQDAGEPGFPNITVWLYTDVNGPPDYTTTTDADGLYIFDQLPADNYTVVVDSTTLPAGYFQTYDPDGILDSKTDVILTAGENRLDIDFGYSTQPTRASINKLTATVENGVVMVEWQTGSEDSTLGFHLERFDEQSNQFQRLNGALLPGLLFSLKGGTYRYADLTAELGVTHTYRLVEVEARGGRRMYGPFTVKVGDKATAAFATRPTSSITFDVVTVAGEQFERSPNMIPGASVAFAATEASGAVDTSGAVGGGDPVGLKIAIRKSGFYTIGSDELSQGLGISAKKARRLIKRGNLSLLNQGQPVAWRAVEGNRKVEFYARSIDSLYTEANIYRLAKGKGQRVGKIRGKSPKAVAMASGFRCEIHVEEDRSPTTGFFDTPDTDYWMWQYFFGHIPELRQHDFEFQVPDRVAGSPGRIIIYLQGGSTADHLVEIRVNDVPVGEIAGSGMTPFAGEIEVPGWVLADGVNTVTLTAMNSAPENPSVFYLDSFDVVYERAYIARDNRLTFTGDGHAVVTVEGFSTKPVVYEVSDPLAVKRVKGAKVRRDGEGGFHVSLVPSHPEARYFAAAADSVATPDPSDVAVDYASDLMDTGHELDYLVLTPAALAVEAWRLAEYRESLGLRSKVVLLEDVYDEFNHGLPSPEAIRDLLSYAWHNWARPPRYVVRCGEGTYDYKDIKGYGENLMPPLMVATPYGLFASENRLADVDGSNDNVPEMAVGILPAENVGILKSMIDKIIAYEAATGEWTRRVVMAADNGEPALDFRGASERVVQQVGPDYTTQALYLDDMSSASVRNGLLDAFDSGALLINYFGHSGINRLADEGLLLNEDIATLANGERLPVFVGMSCSAGP